MDKHNILYLIWKNPKNRRNYTVGKLCRENEKYTFEYCLENEKAQKDGWDLIRAFPEEKKYESETLFPAFASRLPDRKRRNIEDILKKYDLDFYDGFELLRRSGGRLPIDTYEFIDPIFDEDETIERDFFIVGIRHTSGCEGKDCQMRPALKVSMKLKLIPEPSNEYNPDAIQVYTENGKILGYIPRYYSKSIHRRLDKGMTYECIVVETNSQLGCQQCVKVKLIMPKRE